VEKGRVALASIEDDPVAGMEDRLIVRIWDGAAWKAAGPEVIKGSLGEFGRWVFSRIGCDESGVFVFGAFDGASWRQIASIDVGGSMTEIIDVALDPRGSACVVSLDGGPIVRRHSSPSEGWEALGSAPAACTGEYSISFGQDGVPFIAFQEARSFGEISVVSFNGSSRASVGGRMFSNGDAGQFPCVTVNGSGVPVVAVNESGNDNRISVCGYAGGED
jgi:hypothetical protein